ncbi:hypothetical protein AB3G45_13875 [Shinella sp. S4-D37]|uniref:hypothetical protein n=1 Tax=Shinella sp. S4-D37 TaxID=3161999 RepID=UPI003466E724
MLWIILAFILVTLSLVIVLGRSTSRSKLPSNEHIAIENKRKDYSKLTIETRVIITEDDDPEYEQFVRDLWSLRGVPGKGTAIERISGREINRMIVHSLVEKDSRIYVNAIIDGRRKTFAADNRCKWARDGKRFKPDAFRVAIDNKDVSGYLRHETAPDFAEYPLPPAGSLVGLVYSMEYVSGDGEITSRVFRLNRVFDNLQHIILEGFCYLRNEERTLRADRILRLARHQDGSEIAKPLRYFRGFLRSAELNEMGHEATMRRARSGLDMLVWVANADSALTEEEIDVLIDYIDARAGAASEVRSWNRDVARHWVRWHKVTENQALGVASKIPKNGKEMPLVLNFLEQMKNRTPSRLLENRAKKIEKVLSAD